METEKQNKRTNKTNRLTDAEKKLMVAGEKGCGRGLDDKEEGIQNYKLVVTK